MPCCCAPQGRDTDATPMATPGIEPGWKPWLRSRPRARPRCGSGLASHAQQRWPQISQIHTRYRANFAYIDAVLADGEVLRLCRLRYGGSANQRGFAIYRASHDDCEDSYLPTGYRSAPPRKHSTLPAASLRRRSYGVDLNPRRTNGRDH
jgi:hypothetical protein